jgi:hypothetical protein
MKRWITINVAKAAGDLYCPRHCECNGSGPSRPTHGWLALAASSAANTRLFGLAGQLEDRS